MKQLIIIFTFLVSTITLYGQKVKTPKTINQAIEILQADCPDSLKTIISSTPNDSLIFLSYPWGGDYKTISNWTTDFDSKKKTELEKYYSELGITYPKHIETVVLISFKTVLNGDSLNHQEIINPFQTQESDWNKEDKVRFSTDSLRGVYIPVDLEDCFRQINSFWTDSLKTEIKTWTEGEFSGRAHMGFGMWMRNNWQLWGGSRLSKYFNDMGIYHPDDMSGIILTSYYRRLTLTDIRLKKQVNYYQDYWKKAKRKQEKSLKEEFKEFSIGDTVEFRYDYEFISENQENGYMDDSCHATGVIKDKNRKRLQLLVHLLEACDPKGIIIFSGNIYSKSGELLEENKQTIMKRGEKLWTSFDLWY